MPTVLRLQFYPPPRGIACFEIKKMNFINTVCIQRADYLCTYKASLTQVCMHIVSKKLEGSSPMGNDRSPGSQHNVWRYIMMLKGR